MKNTDSQLIAEAYVSIVEGEKLFNVWIYDGGWTKVESEPLPHEKAQELSYKLKAMGKRATVFDVDTDPSTPNVSSSYSKSERDEDAAEADYEGREEDSRLGDD